MSKATHARTWRGGSRRLPRRRAALAEALRMAALKRYGMAVLLALATVAAAIVKTILARYGG